MRAPSSTCTSWKWTVWSSVAEWTFTGTKTPPKAIVPFQIERSLATPWGYPRAAAANSLAARERAPVGSKSAHGLAHADPAVRGVRGPGRRTPRARGRVALAQGQEPREAARALAGTPRAPRAGDRVSVAGPGSRGGGEQLPPGALRRAARARARRRRR